MADPMEKVVETILKEVGEDPSREGLVRTPQRVAKSLRYLTGGYQRDVHAEINGAIFQSHNKEMVLVRDIDFYSMCEHHMLPFFGRAHVAYIPDGKIIGLSKLARIVDIFARRLQVQELLTTQVAECLQESLSPKGVGVVMQAQHLCMMMRGVQKQNSQTITSEMLGDFRDNQATRTEFLSLIG